MATSPRNTKYRVIQDVVTFGAASGTVFNEGDLVVLNTGTGLISAVSSGTAQFLLGDVQGTQPTTHINNQQFTNAFPVYVGRHTCKLIARDAGAFIMGVTPVYHNTAVANMDAQSFSIASGSEAYPIGVILTNPKEYGGAVSGTTAIGSEYEVLLRKSYVLEIA